MTLAQLRTEIWQQAGEPSDLDPTTDVQYNGGPLLTWAVNEAQRQIAFWKDPVTHAILRFRSLEGEMFTQWLTVTGTLDADGTTTTVVLPSGSVGDQDDRYNGWLITIGSDTKMVVDYVGATLTATVHEAFTSAPLTGTTFTLAKRHGIFLDASHPWQVDHITLPSTTNRFQATGNLFEVLKVEDLSTQRTLVKAPRGETYLSKAFTAGDPSFWYRSGQKLMFDTAVDPARWLRLVYYRGPTDMVNATDQPELPEPFHWAMVLWGISWAARRQGETSEKWTTDSDLTSLMRSLKSQYEMEFEQDDDAGVLQVR